MKIAVVGATGLLGRAVYNELKIHSEWTVIGTALKRSSDEYKRVDLLNKDEIELFMASEKPDVIIIAAAEKSPEVCEKNPEYAIAINVTAPQIFAEAAKKTGAWVLYFSTDYVFDGKSPPYPPEAAPKPLNSYGKSKMSGEQILRETTQNVCILRLPLLYGEIERWDESAVTTLVTGLLKSQPFSIDDWAIRYPTHTSDVAVVCCQMIAHKIRNPDFNGTFHWSGNEPLTKCQMAYIMAQCMGLNATNIIPQREMLTGVARPYDCHLDTTALNRIGIGQITSFQTGITAVINKYMAQQREFKLI